MRARPKLEDPAGFGTLSPNFDHTVAWAGVAVRLEDLVGEPPALD